MKGTDARVRDGSQRGGGSAFVLRYRSLAKYPLHQWRWLSVIVGVMALSSIAAVAQPWPLKFLVDHAIGDVPVPDMLDTGFRALAIAPTARAVAVFSAIAMIAVVLMSAVLAAVMTWAVAVAGQRMSYDVAADLLNKLQRRSLTTRGHEAVGDQLSRLSVDATTLGTTLPSLLGPLQQAFILIVVLRVAWTLDVTLTLVTGGVAIPVVLSARLFGGRLMGAAMRLRQADAGLMSFTHQTLIAIPVVKAFLSETRNTERYRMMASSAATSMQRSVTLASALRSSGTVSGAAGLATVIFVGALRVSAGSMSIGTLLVFITYLGTIQMGFMTLTGAYAKVKVAAVSADRVLEVLELTPGVEERADARVLKERVRGLVELEGVRFGYETGRAVLEDVTVRAEPGELVAVVGATGAGKSTLVGLIPRFFDPWSGRVKIDGEDVRDLTLESLRRQVSLVLQEPFLLPLTVAENIVYGRPDATHREVVEAAKAARADEFIRALPEGYETVIGERGDTLSGGERQRLAIARALLKDAPILILDEPTSALDSATEAEILEALTVLMQGRTTFVIAHRLSTIQGASQVIVLEDGRVVETGTPAELAHAGGRFQELHASQLT